MSEEKYLTLDIPESIDRYKVTLFWGLTVTQVILVFLSVLFTGFTIFSVVLKRYFTAILMFVMVGLSLLGIVEIRGRNFYRYILFILSYYENKPRVLIYHHYATSGAAAIQAKQLVYEQEKNTKTFVFIFIALFVGIALLIGIGIYLFYVLHS
jgi:hypothetical protein